MDKFFEEFIKYTNNYKEYGVNILRKTDHTFRVVKLCEEIAKSLNLEEDDIYLAKLGGLLHDIGRFEQYKNYRTFKDEMSIDHGDLGCQLLETELKDKFTTSENEEIIKKIVKNHNKYKIEEDLTEKEILLCNIIRDADKIDIFNLVLNSNILDLENSTISDDVYEAFLNKQLVLKEQRKTKADNLVCNLAFIYDINFKKSLEIIKNEDYLNRLINKYLDTKNSDLKEKLLNIQEFLNNYLKGV